MPAGIDSPIDSVAGIIDITIDLSYLRFTALRANQVSAIAPTVSIAIAATQSTAS